MKWTKKPVTWGGYAKFATICVVISGIITFVSWVVTWEPAWFTKTKKFIKRVFGKTKEH